jgi:hypothetical protein
MQLTLNSNRSHAVKYSNSVKLQILDCDTKLILVYAYAFMFHKPYFDLYIPAREHSCYKREIKKVGCRINVFRAFYKLSRKEETMEEENTERKRGRRTEREKVRKKQSKHEKRGGMNEDQKETGKKKDVECFCKRIF